MNFQILDTQTTTTTGMITTVVKEEREEELMAAVAKCTVERWEAWGDVEPIPWGFQYNTVV